MYTNNKIVILNRNHSLISAYSAVKKIVNNFVGGVYELEENFHDTDRKMEQHGCSINTSRPRAFAGHVQDTGHGADGTERHNIGQLPQDDNCQKSIRKTAISI